MALLKRISGKNQIPMNTKTYAAQFNSVGVLFVVVVVFESVLIKMANIAIIIKTTNNAQRSSRFALKTSPHLARPRRIESVKHESEIVISARQRCALMCRLSTFDSRNIEFI